MTDFVAIQTELARVAELAIALHLGEAMVRVPLVEGAPLEEGSKLVRLFPQLKGVVMGCDGTLLESGKWGSVEPPRPEDADPPGWGKSERIAYHAQRIAGGVESAVFGEDDSEGERPPYQKPPVEPGYEPAQSRGCTKRRPCVVCKSHGGKKPPKMSKKEWAKHMAKLFPP